MTFDLDWRDGSSWPYKGQVRRQGHGSNNFPSAAGIESKIGKPVTAIEKHIWVGNCK